MEQSGTSTPLLGTVHDLAAGVVSALRGGDHVPVAGRAVVDDSSAGFLTAAVRVLGADLLLPDVLFHTSPDAGELAVFRKAVEAFPPGPDATPAVRWSHWAMARALRRFEPSFPHEPHAPGRPSDPSGPLDPLDGEEGAEPCAAWLDAADWRSLTHQLAVLAALAVPGEDSAVARAARGRPIDVARGFVRAVRRRDWQQAAGAGRWLTQLDGVPDTLGLGTGLDFVELMGGTDPRVTLQVQAARILRTGARV
ncbi:hypothetical protein ABZT03_40015 [Streptomyces sp. NPDC005574]|uniref:hypothetical protein n=1 Tax=Streptomyces sp. NPDC005574 TaxID=3156891 RepID=UPI0033BAE759